MVKCPKGSPSQVKANLAFIRKLKCLSSENSFSAANDSEHTAYKGESVGEELDFDSIQADKRSPPTPKDELVYFFISYFLDILLESWVGKPLYKSKLSANVQSTSSNQSMELGEAEDLGPCYPSSSSSTDIQQQKKTSNSNETDSNYYEYSKEESFESLKSQDPLKTFIPDENVDFVFFNGVRYKGRVSRRLMDGEGVYFWEDGSSYQGGFIGGCATGVGKLEFPDLSFYEGGVYKAFRHGEGMFCMSESPVTYSGQWWLGKKHGEGLIVYNNASNILDFYRGGWVNGMKEGFGFRQYPSGSKYIGFWSNGKRHGIGLMLWSNNDIYWGEWKEGLMHGYGEYTWNGFINKMLSYPSANTYRGSWSQGKRNGRGSFEAFNGALLETTWEDNQKEGPGTVVCNNGSVVTANSLFHRDKPALLCKEDDKIGLVLKDHFFRSRQKVQKGEVEKNLMAYLRSVEKAKAISIPIHSPVYTINLEHCMKKYFYSKKIEFLRTFVVPKSDFKMIRIKPDLKHQNQNVSEVFLSNISDMDHTVLLNCVNQEEKHLRSYILSQILPMKICFEYYSTLACEEIPPFKCVLMKLFLWQMFLDTGIANSKLSLIDIDNLLAHEEYILIEYRHNPFEKIQFWQFIQILIVLSWHIYGQYVFESNFLIIRKKVIRFLEFHKSTEDKLVMKNALKYFLEHDVFHEKFPNILKQQKRMFEESHLVPMEAIYEIYCTFGVPHSATDFLRNICYRRCENVKPLFAKFFENLPVFIAKGKNAMSVTGQLYFIPGPLTFSEISKLAENADAEPQMDQYCLSCLEPIIVLEHLIATCPNITKKDFGVVNMEYQLTFLEFYKAITLSIELAFKRTGLNKIRKERIRRYAMQMDEYEKFLRNFEKAKYNK